MGRASHARGAATGELLVLPRWRVRREATLEAMVAHYLADCQQRVSADQLSPLTLHQYTQGLGYWRTFCAAQQPPLADPREVSPDHLAAYAAWLAPRNNRISVASWLRVVRALFNRVSRPKRRYTMR